MEAHLERNKTLSSRQYGFRVGRTTVDAALQVVKTAKSAIADKKFCAAAVSLDIKNALAKNNRVY